MAIENSIYEKDNTTTHNKALYAISAKTQDAHRLGSQNKINSEINMLTPTIEFPPLLAPGLYDFDLKKLRSLCVDSFPTSSTRGKIMDSLDVIISEIEHAAIPAEILIDGSFLTLKENPNDSDIVVKVNADTIDNGTVDQKNILRKISSNLKSSHLCDSYILVMFPTGSPHETLNMYNMSYWIRQFGFSRGNDFKGIAVVKTGGII